MTDLTIKYAKLYEAANDPLQISRTRTHRKAVLDKKIMFLERLEILADIARTAKALNISKSTITHWRYIDPAFDSYVTDVLNIWRGSGDVRKCRTCLNIKPVTEFEQRPDRPNQRTTCRVCKRIQGRQSYARNKLNAFFRHKASRARSRSASLGIPFDLDAEYLESIWTGVCPVFGYTLDCTTPRGIEMSPELDRIIPEKGYVRGNVMWISRKANAMKRNGSIEELKLIIAWLEKTTREAEKCAA